MSNTQDQNTIVENTPQVVDASTSKMVDFFASNNKHNVFTDERFQKKLIKLIIECRHDEDNDGFAENIIELIKPEFFTSLFPRQIIQNCIDYYLKYNNIPEYDTLINIIEAKPDQEIIKENLIDLLHGIKESKVNDKKYIKENSLDFCKRQAIRTALHKIAENWNSYDYDGMIKLLQEAISLGMSRETGYDYVKDVLKRLVEHARNPITAMEGIDKYIKGGLAGGELGVVVGPTGSGKSMMLVKFASEAFKAGKKVLYVTLELSEIEISHRFDACLLGIQINEVLDYAEKIKEAMHEFDVQGSKRMKIKEWPMRFPTVNTIRNEVRLLEREGFGVPDIIFIDYATVMKPIGNYKEKRFAVTSIIEDLKALARELNRPIWTAAQANREAINEETFDVSNIGESLGIAQTADLLVGIARPDSLKQIGEGKMIIMKNRLGDDGFYVDLFFDASRVAISTKDSSFSNSTEGFDGLADESVESIMRQKHQNENKIKFDIKPIKPYEPEAEDDGYEEPDYLDNYGYTGEDFD